MEEYFYGYNVQRPHQLRSATKSVVSTLAGIAVDRGALTGPGEVVLPHMNYTSYAHPDPRKAAITLGNFLSMSSGLDCNDHSSTSPGREMVIDDTPDWVKATLDLPMINDPGTKGYYCSGGVAVVGRLVENVVHMRLPEFAQANLFAPLGIARAAVAVELRPDQCRQGILADPSSPARYAQARDSVRRWRPMAWAPGGIRLMGTRVAGGTESRGQCQLRLFLVASLVECRNSRRRAARGCNRCARQWRAEDLSGAAVRSGRSLYRRRLQRGVHSSQHHHGEDHSARVDGSSPSKIRVSCPRNGLLGRDGHRCDVFLPR